MAETRPAPRDRHERHDGRAGDDHGEEMNVTTKHRLTFEIDAAEGSLADYWPERRNLAWRRSHEALSRHAATHRHRHLVSVTLVGGGEDRAGNRRDVVRMAVDVEAENEADATLLVLELLDMARGTKAAEPAHAHDEAALRTRRIPLAGPSIIGPMPEGWPVGRRLTGFSAGLGGTRTSLAGWQANEGSWFVLPLADAAERLVLTREREVAAPDSHQVAIAVERGPATGGHGPEHLRETCPVVRRFEARRDGFVMEAGSEGDLVRYELAVPGDDVGAWFTLCHDATFAA